MTKTKPTLIIDTREKTPLKITCGRIYGDIVREKIDTGDYTIAGLEDYLCIERKGAISEVATNLFEERFYRELDRMNHKYSFVIFEFTLEELLNYPKGCGLSPRIEKRIKVNGKLLTSKVIELQLKYPHIHFVFVGNNAIEYVNRICRKVVEAEW